MAFLDDIMTKLSKGKRAGEVNEVILGNMIGFYRLDPTVQVGQLILEIAHGLNGAGKRVCIIETNPLSDFYISKFGREIKQMESKEIPSLSTRFMNSKAPLSDCLIDADDKLKILTFGNTPYTSMTSMDYEIVEQTFLEVKDNFDIVLVDICNLPFFETVTAGIKTCSRIYNMWGATPNSVTQHTKLMSFLKAADIDMKLKNVILCDVPYGVTVIKRYESLSIIDAKFVLEIPEVPMAKAMLEDKYISDKLSCKEAKGYCNSISFLCNEILLGSGGAIDANVD